MRLLIDDEEFDLDGGYLMAVYLTDEEKQLIANMAPDDHVFSVRGYGAPSFSPDVETVTAWLAKFKKNSESKD